MEKERLSLLKDVDNLPESPCGNCGEISCGGKCGKFEDFEKAWKPYKDAGLEGVANNIIEAHEMTARMREIAGKMNAMFSKEELRTLKIPVLGETKKVNEANNRLVKNLLKGVTACFTGRRPKDLWGYEPKRGEYEILTNITAEHVEDLVLAGYRRFVTGGAQGFDHVAFDAVEIVKKKYPELEIQNILYVPCKGQESKWAKSGLFSQESYKKMLDAADEVVYVHDRPYESSKDLMDRNHAMNDVSSRCVALWPKSEGIDFRTTMKSGTAECMRDAERNGLVIDIIDPEEVEMFLRETLEIEKKREEDGMER